MAILRKLVCAVSRRRRGRFLLYSAILFAVLNITAIIELPFRILASFPCKIPGPDVNNYEKSFQRVLKQPAEDPECSKLFPLYFESTVDSELVPAMTVDQFRAHKITSCCYFTITRDHDDFTVKFSPLCYPISLEAKTRVHPSHEFIAILCGNETRYDSNQTDIPRMLWSTSNLRLVDAHAFVPLKPEVEVRLGNISASGDRPNIILLGMDAISRAHFVRSLPETHKYLIEKMGAIEMKGYHKIGRNTLPNVARLLTSDSYPSLLSNCVNRKDQFDACPFIWKDFASKGYRTAFDEDSMRGIFVNYLGGFQNQPTDYYSRTYIQIVGEYFKTEKTKADLTTCSGPRLAYEGMMDHMMKLSYKMNKLKKPFFYFSWEATLTHEDFNDAALVEKPLLNTLMWLKENDQLDNTILVVFSNHGLKNPQVRMIRQAKIEAVLPFVYLVFPDRFKKKYSRAMHNLNLNRGRLTTALDLNHALHDILNLDRIKNDELRRREEKLEVGSSQGISLFLPMPPNRTCIEALIDHNFCICTFIGRH